MHDAQSPEGEGKAVADVLRDLGFHAQLFERDAIAAGVERLPIALPDGTEPSLLERILRRVPVEFDKLPLLVEGESKEVRLWTEGVVLIRFKPTVYSFTRNRYGEAPGTDALRLRFTAALFRRMTRPKHLGGAGIASAFLGEIDSAGGPLLAQRRVEPGNLEIRIKRYHIGSPVHRYRFTEKHESTLATGAVRRWTRFDRPVVCFDWRNPLRDEQGNRLADEPLSDDYARIWMHDVDHAKSMARDVFLWMEEWFGSAAVRLVDLCLFVDQAGHTIFGEISPDCMRVHLTNDEPERAHSADKDLWRAGKTPEVLFHRYAELYRRLFGDA